MGSCGNRDVIRYLCQHKLVQCVVTTAGAVEEDIMKCKTPHYIGDFHLSGRVLRKAGINRLGNLLVPNANYCAFEDFVTPLLTRMLEEQKQGKVAWTPSRVIKRLGEEVRSEESFCYWCARNDIPVFCPALTDGSLGDMIFFHSFAKPGLVIDIVEDLRAINSMALFARKTGMIILGGGVVKHHTCNANLMRNGADFSVFINTAADFDGSDAGAQPDEAISWGKIRMDARPVKVHGDAALIFPLLVAQTFAKEVQRRAAERGGAAAPAPAPAPATKH
jgi:deoxyhypusine synthase